MDTTRPCGCKGIRTCLICEVEFNISKPDFGSQLKRDNSYVYCPFCDKCWPGWDADLYKEHPHHKGNAINFPGIYIKLDFLTAAESIKLMNDLDELPWELSQSGRRKQNFGPKCNFKKQRLRLGTFNGFPHKTKFVQEKLMDVPVLHNYKSIEQCTLEYDPARGASIDPHIDDCWVWGERIVTVNVLGDSVLTMIPYSGPITRYNLESVLDYSKSLGDELHLSNDILKDACIEDQKNDNIVVRIPMPARSLIVLHGLARYKWEHAVLREDITSRRVCLAYRELTPPYLSNKSDDKEVLQILEKASNFW